MISASLRFEGFDARSWTNLLALFAPGVVERRAEDPTASDAPEIDRAAAGDDVPRGSLVVVVDENGRTLTAFHTLRGRVRDLTYAGPSDMARLCADYRAKRCFVMREGVMEEIGERLGSRLQRGDDYLTQWLVLARAARELQEAGVLSVWPRPPEKVPVPTAGMVRRAFDLVFADDRSVVAVLWDGSVIYTGIVLRRRGGELDLIAGPDAIAAFTGPLGGDWRRDYRVVSDAVSRAVAPVHLGLFAEARTIRKLLRTADPGAWAKAVAVRDVIVHPTPPYVAVALGADAVRAVAKRSSALLGGLDALSALAPVARYVRNRIGEVASVSTVLGFDPLRALAGSLRRYGPTQTPSEPPPPRDRTSSSPPPEDEDEASGSTDAPRGNQQR